MHKITKNNLTKTGPLKKTNGAETIGNNTLWVRIEYEIRKRKWSWIGHRKQHTTSLDRHKDGTYRTTGNVDSQETRDTETWQLRQHKQDRNGKNWV